MLALVLSAERMHQTSQTWLQSNYQDEIKLQPVLIWICIYAVYLNQWCYTSTRQKGREDALHNFIPARNYVHEWWSDVGLESQFWEYKVLGGESYGRKGKQQLGKGKPTTQYAIFFLSKPSILCNLICSSRSILAHNSNSCRTSNSGVGGASNSNSCRT